MALRIARFSVIWKAIEISRKLMTEWVGEDHGLQTEVFYKFADALAAKTNNGKNSLPNEQLEELFIEVASS